MKLYYPITVDLYKPYPLPLVEAQQNNIGRGVLVTLTAQGAVITPTGESIQLYAKKPDGTISYLACTLTGSQIECDFTNQMLALPGTVEVELQMIGGAPGAETEITTPIFAVKVNPSNVDDSAIESQDEFPALVTALAEVAELKANGLKGDPGEAATIQVGTVTASDPGSNPQVTNSGTEQNAILNFVLPRGQQGPQGIPGEGVTFGEYSAFPNPGQTNVLYVDNTVSPARAYVWDGEKYVPAGGAAADVSYDNESSGLTAQTVQEAIDENAQNISSLNSRFVGISKVDEVTSTGERQNTGVTVDIPAGAFFCFTAIAVFNNSPALWVGISENDNVNACHANANSGLNNASCTLSGVNNTDDDISYHIFAQWSGQANNEIRISGFYVRKS